MAIQKFQVLSTPATFVENVMKELSGRPLGNIVQLKFHSSTIMVHFSKLGTSELQYKVVEQDRGFQAELQKESIAFTHKAFRTEIEKKLSKVLERCGAQMTI